LYLKLEGTVRNLNLRSPLEVTYKETHAVKITLRPPNSEEQNTGQALENAMIITDLAIEPSSTVRGAFLSLSRNEIPEGCTIPESERTLYVDEVGRLRSDRAIRMEYMPQPFRDFTHQLYEEMWDYTRRSAQVLRWRLAGTGPHNPFSIRGFSWSLDGNAWRPMPIEWRAIATVLGIRSPVTPAEWNEVCSIVQDGKSEPLGHELYREAWDRRIDSPKSALIVGIAALEVGFKNFVSELVPQTQWLLENLPSPPIHKMLKEYLPKIQTRNTINGEVLSPPSRVMEIIRNGVNKRNTAAHVGTATVTYDEVNEILLAVLDVLWMLDYYRGLNWALENMRPEIRGELAA